MTNNTNVKGVKVNRIAKTIEITKAFNRKASIYGTDEYKELTQICKDNEGFDVVLRESAKKPSKNSMKGLTYDFMERYIKAHDDADKTKMHEYMELRGLDDESIEYGLGSLDRSDIVEWFLKEFEEVRAFHEKRDERSVNLADARRERKEKIEKDKFEARRKALLEEAA